MSRFLAALMLGAAVVAVAGCGGGGKKSSSSDMAQIEQNWTAFFSGSTPADQKIGLLENGQRFAQVIKAQANSPLAKQSKAQVSSVTVNGSRATVKYTITLAGKPALKNQSGTAVKQGGAWKVSDTSFCQLLALQGSPPPPCPHG